MSFSVNYTPDFERQFKKLKKRYPSISHDLRKLVESLREDPTQGIPLGGTLYKVRLAIESKGKGKSGGARVFTYLITEDKEVYLVYIYDKAELENLTKKQILEILKRAGLL